MSTVTSADGTTIAYDQVGDGPALILVDGALGASTSYSTRPLAALLADRFTVYRHDRRGRGASADTPPYAPQREVEDIQAMVRRAGGSAHLYGYSAGAVLALDAAAQTPGITRLALYEPPFVIDGSRTPLSPDIIPRTEALLAADRRADAVRLFFREGGVSGVVVALMRVLPLWPKLVSLAHTLPYDLAIIGDTQSGRPLPPGRWSGATMPTLVTTGGKSPAFFHSGAEALVGELSDARHDVIAGQTHRVKPEAIAPVLAAFLTA